MVMLTSPSERSALMGHSSRGHWQLYFYGFTDLVLCLNNV